MIFLDDYTIGDRYELGQYTFSADAIKRFAKAFDPQSFHVDEKAAEDSLFGGLCASGWHTAAIWIRLMTDYRQRAIHEARTGGSSVGRYGSSPGFEAMRWLKPVYAGDTILYSSEVVGVRALRSRPGWGLVSIQSEGCRDDGAPVFALKTHVMVQMRDKYGDGK